MSEEVLPVKRGRGRPRKIVPEVKAIKEEPKLPHVTFTNNTGEIAINVRRVGSLYASSGGTLFIGPTHNCQVFSIASFANAVSCSNTQDELLHILKSCSVKVGKRICLVDVKAGCAARVRSKLKKYIILDQPYASTNGSDMCLFLIKIWPAIQYDYSIKMDKIQKEYK